MTCQLDCEVIVELWSARIPGFARFAEHHWLVICREGRADRWEIWQAPGKCKSSWGHLHCNLMRPALGAVPDESFSDAQLMTDSFGTVKVLAP